MSFRVWLVWWMLRGACERSGCVGGWWEEVICHAGRYSNQLVLYAARERFLGFREMIVTSEMGVI